MRTAYDRRGFAFPNLPGWPWNRNANRLCLHTDGNPRAHTAAGALAWGNRERAFSIHMYADGEKGYWAIPLNWQAFHVRRSDIAAARGHTVTWPGLSQRRGDIIMLGFEHVMRADGTWSQDTRITSVLMGAELFKAQPAIASVVSEHALWDPTDRAFDVGDALWLPDWVLDVKDLAAGRVAFRTVGEVALPQPFEGEPPDVGPIDPDGDWRSQMAELAARVLSTESAVAAVDIRVDSVEDRTARHLAT